MKLTLGQEFAADTLVQWLRKPDHPTRMMSLSGPAGTGKSTALSLLRSDFVELTGGNVEFCATTGKAARRLHEIIDAPTSTFHALVYAPPDQSEQDRLEFGTLRRPPFDPVERGLVVVDEASMMTPKMVADVDPWIERGIRFLFVGDPIQLPPVISKREAEKHGEDYTIFADVTGPVLDEVVRSDDELIQVATELRETGVVPHAVNGAYEYEGQGRNVVAHWMADPDDHMLITWRNAIRMHANNAIRDALGRQMVLPEPGEEILFRKNGQGVLNGETAVVDNIEVGPKLADVQTYELTTAEGRTIRVSCDGRTEPMDGALPAVGNWKRYQDAIKQQRIDEGVDDWTGRIRPALRKDPIPITWAYCRTCHNAQGDEARRVTVFLPAKDLSMGPFRRLTRLPDGRMLSHGVRLIYTAITRAKRHATLVIQG